MGGRSQEIRRSAGFRWVAAMGLGARAAVYGLLGVLVAQIVAAGRPAGPADTQGAFAAIAAHPAGRGVLAVVAAGLGAYAVWRFVEAGARTPQGRRVSAWARVGWAAAGLLYVALCAEAVDLAAGGTANGPTQHPAPFAADVLRLPVGQVLLGLLATALASGGVALVVWGARHDYRGDLRRRTLPRPAGRAVAVCGVVGNAARGAVVLLVSAFLYSSAVSGDPEKAKSLDAALRTLARGAAGAPLLALVALGFLAFGLFSLAEARYRRL